MNLARRRASVFVLATSLIGAALAVPPVAQAATCQSVPGATPGTDLRIAGQDYRVPAISGIAVCAGGASVPLVAVDLARGGGCASPCLSVFLVGDDADVGPITVSYTEDGSPRSSTTNPDGVAGPGDECLLSVGSPAAPYPDCFNAIGPDLGDPAGGLDGIVDQAVGIAGGALATAQTIAGQTIATAQAIANQAVADALVVLDGVLDDVGDTSDPVFATVDSVRDGLQDPAGFACSSVPPQDDPNQWGEEVTFCDNPGQWLLLLADDVCSRRPNQCTTNPSDALQEAVWRLQEVLCIADDGFCVEE